VYPDFKLGNIRELAISDLVDSLFQQDFGRSKQATLPKYCRECEVRFACNGGCPKQRFLLTPDDEKGLNYLCSGYRFVFNKMAPYMDAMAGLLRMQQPPAEVMDLIRQKRLAKPS